MWSTLYHFLTHNQFLNSNFFVGGTTLLVGYAAYFLYKRQKRDEKKDAATILLAEIRGATAILPGLASRFKQSKNLEEGLVLLPSESWSKYKYLFVNDLEAEEWRALDAFYANCLAYDCAVTEKQSYFAQNTGQIWVSIHKHYYEELHEYFENNPDLPVTLTDRGKLVEIDPVIAERINAFTDTYIANSIQLAGYDPIKPTNDAERALTSLNQDLLLSSLGTRLQAISESRSMLSRLLKKLRYQ